MAQCALITVFRTLSLLLDELYYRFDLVFFAPSFRVQLIKRAQLKTFFDGFFKSIKFVSPGFIFIFCFSHHLINLSSEI